MARKFPPDPKSLLIQLNIEMDELVSEILWQEQQAFNSYHRSDTPPRAVEPGLPTYRYDHLVNIDAPINSLHSSSFPTDVERYVLLLEDRYFLQHSGFDFRSIPRLIKQAMFMQRFGGISTIEQQFVRTVFKRRERTIRRKAHETILAWILSYRSSKGKTLRAYLSIAYFGYRLRGCDEASRLIFNRNADDLKGDDAAFLASLLVYPLPKRLQLTCFDRGYFPVTDLSTFLNGALKDDIWMKCVSRRMRYALHLADKSKKSLE